MPKYKNIYIQICKSQGDMCNFWVLITKETSIQRCKTPKSPRKPKPFSCRHGEALETLVAGGRWGRGGGEAGCELEVPAEAAPEGDEEGKEVGRVPVDGADPGRVPRGDEKGLQGPQQDPAEGYPSHPRRRRRRRHGTHRLRKDRRLPRPHASEAPPARALRRGPSAHPFAHQGFGHPDFEVHQRAWQIYG